MGNNDLWIKKYRPKSIADIIGNSNQIYKIINWLKNFHNEKSQASIIISGNHGIGKSIIIKIILEELDYTIKFLYSNNVKSQKVINEIIQTTVKSKNIYDFMNGTRNKKYAIVIDDTETITLSSEKNVLQELYKENEKLKYFPIIFLSSFQHSKLISDIKKTCQDIIFTNPSNSNMITLIKKIISKENINIQDDKVIEKIIIFSQYDIRRLINILNELYLSYKNEEITKTIITEYIKNSQKKNMDIGLFDATRKTLDSYSGINNCIILYETEKVLLPLMIHENFYKNFLTLRSNNKKTLNIMKHVSNAISKGDVIETNIYTDQNWYLQNIHGFFTCAMTSYHINKQKFNKTTNNSSYNIGFSSDLNKTSLKNINKKNITNMQNLIPNKSVNDILYINRLLYYMIKDNKLQEVYNLVNKYNLNIKNIEVAIKIDKTLEKLVMTPKSKKMLALYLKKKDSSNKN